MSKIPEYVIADVAEFVSFVLESDRGYARSEYPDKIQFDRVKAALTANNEVTEILVNGFFTALRTKKTGAVRGFLELGISPDCVEPSPLQTPALVAAVRVQDKDSVNLLLQFGASVEARDNHQINALTAACQLKNSDIIACLEMAGATHSRASNSLHSTSPRLFNRNHDSDSTANMSL
ncbi:ankyrin repeat domain-containing protein [Legionella waltersii]|uniref:Ankyrin repeats (3 copies) n=1 Tax=Legionella waltersii TaxID=66969 RepID=A0A0W1AKA6_9GAMM|nr:ankyrin repeat domain-containing protein [Legionella waltersii]KTD81753.1 Ankyrin repeats (3 copies) [Legionella waltersii]SNU97088.1 Ankyrin repeats (3 copies) [Legionella waltersii]